LTWFAVGAVGLIVFGVVELFVGNGSLAPNMALSNAANEPAMQRQGPTDPPQTGDMLQRACRENVTGFERAYTLTFYLAFVALLLGMMLPGWPAKWVGRQTVDAPVSPH
jgi:hypothetical protein